MNTNISFPEFRNQAAEIAFAIIVNILDLLAIAFYTSVLWLALACFGYRLPEAHENGPQFRANWPSYLKLKRFRILPAHIFLAGSFFLLAKAPSLCLLEFKIILLIAAATFVCEIISGILHELDDRSKRSFLLSTNI